MNKSGLLLAAVLCCAAAPASFAQEENYQPVQIIDSLDNISPPPASVKEKPKAKPEEKKENEDAKSALQKRKDNLKRLRFGGNFGLQFGSYTYINLSPTVGYMVVKKRLELGGGPIFIYERFRDYYYNNAYSFFVYGPDVYARGYIWRGLYLEARYDLVNKPSYYDIYNKIWVNHLLLGAGYAAPIGKIGSFYISAMFNVLNNKESIYRGTFGNFPLILNMGFGFGIGGRE